MNCNLSAEAKEGNRFWSPGDFFRASAGVARHFFQNIIPIYFFPGRMDPVFREKVCLTVTWANRCRA